MREPHAEQKFRCFGAPVMWGVKLHEIVLSLVGAFGSPWATKSTNERWDGGGSVARARGGE